MEWISINDKQPRYGEECRIKFADGREGGATWRDGWFGYVDQLSLVVAWRPA